MSANKPKYQFGDIYLIKFHPAAGAEFKRFRPGVILSEKINQLDNRFALVAPLTSDTTKRNQFELLIKNNPSLEKDSLLLTWYLRTLDTSRLEKQLGTLSPPDKTKLKRVLSNLF